VVEESILDLDDSRLTPGMRQYRDAKRANPDCIIMLRMGDFYELFYEDAITAARELEITLTARGKGEKRAPLAGIPYHALENYLGRFIKKGYKVAIIEQLENPKKAKGLVKRGLVRIVTPGTVIESSLLDEKENNYLMALSVKGEVYSLAFSDLSTGEFFTFSVQGMSSLMHEVVRFNPQECILPSSLFVNRDLIENVKKLGCYVNSMEDYFFQVEKARELIREHFSQSEESFGLSENNISVSGALLRYLLDTQRNSLSHLKRISLRSNQQTMLLDGSSFRNLELVKNLQDNSTRGTLLSVLDKTITAMGSRLLKRWLKSPLLQKNKIESRLEAVSELNKKVIVREEISDLLKDIYDLERLIGRINYGNALPKDLLSLRNSLEKIPFLKNKLSDFSSDLLGKISGMDNLEEVVTLVKKAIKEDPANTIREGGVINPNFNEELQELHEITFNSKKYIQQLEEKEKSRTGINGLRIAYNRVFGYFIEVTKRNISLVPEEYIRKQTTANSERYITEELKIIEEKILGAQEKINILEYNLFQEIVKKIALQTKKVQGVAQKIAVLDVLSSFAKISMENRYTMPLFVDENVLQIKNGRHPVVEKMAGKFIANDVVLEDGEIMIITGPNMSGKSTAMRQAALIVLMAQMGCFVPADECVLGIVDRIFTRVGASDDLTSGRSTFMVEMHETAAILNNATSRSLVIMDEIGRGTSTFDGVSIAWSVAEHLYNVNKAKTLFATHYHVLNKLAEKFERVKNYNIAVREIKGEIIFLRKLIEGGTDQSYGVHVAELAGLPKEVVERARDIQEALQKDDEMMQKLQVKKIKEQKSLQEF